MRSISVTLIPRPQIAKCIKIPISPRFRQPRFVHHSTNSISSLTSRSSAAHSAAKRCSHTAFQHSSGTPAGLVRCCARPKSMMRKLGVVRERSSGGCVSGPGWTRMLRTKAEFCTKRAWWRRRKREQISSLGPLSVPSTRTGKGVVRLLVGLA